MRMVLITGVAQGIGKALAESLSHHYSIIGIDCIAPKHTYCERFYSCDLSQLTKLQETIAQIKKETSTLYGLVNNAAIFSHIPLAKQSLEAWEKTLAVNLSAPYLLSQSFAPLLSESHGHIINIASTRAGMSEAGTEPYSASKGGLIALTHALCISLSGQVSVNAISPGWINTDENYTPTEEENAWHASGRVGKPKDIVEVVTFLLERSDGFITGSNFVIDGGVTRKMVYP